MSFTNFLVPIFLFSTNFPFFITITTTFNIHTHKTIIFRAINIQFVLLSLR